MAQMPNPAQAPNALTVPFRVYGLVDPAHPNDIRYVGITSTGGRTRIGIHINDACLQHKQHPVARWIRDLVAGGRLPEEVPLNAFHDERTAIKALREAGHDLLNAAPGRARTSTKPPLSAKLVGMLGTVPDSIIATQAGLSTRTVQRRRDVRGIPPCTPRRWIDWSEIDPHLGTAPDAELARRFGVSRSAVSERRRGRHVPPFGRRAPDRGAERGRAHHARGGDAH